jgi:hypothetical protein
MSTRNFWKKFSIKTARDQPGNPHAANEGRSKISRKISHLVKEENKTQKQAVGQALGMARQGDLGPAAKRSAGRKKK